MNGKTSASQPTDAEAAGGPGVAQDGPEAAEAARGLT